LWTAISRRTTFRVDYSSTGLVAEAVRRLTNPDISPQLVRPAFVVSKSRVNMDRVHGVGGNHQMQSMREADMVIDYPDLVGEVAVEVPVSRSTVRRVIEQSGRLGESTRNPAEFRRQVVGALRSALAATLATSDGVTYTPRSGADERWDARLIVERMAEAYEDTLVDVKKSIYDRIPVDSDIERDFAVALDAHPDVVLFVKLPGWFKVDTPVGGYNPDWAIVRRTPAGTHLYLVRETKGSANLDDLFREHEVWKVTFARQHFGAIDVDYRVVATIGDLDSDVKARLINVEVDRAPA
jgi:type III restriction enzyme